MSTNLQPVDSDHIRSRRSGVIEIMDGQFYALHFRRWPKWATVIDILWTGPRYHSKTTGNRCLLYYHQPRRFPNFLALNYVLSTRDCTLSSLHAGMRVLDRIAEVKKSDALLCDAWNSRLSDRVLTRYGWQPHTDSRWHRNYIKRFYGVYPHTIANASTATIDLVTVPLPR